MILYSYFSLLTIRNVNLLTKLRMGKRPRDMKTALLVQIFEVYSREHPRGTQQNK